MKKRFFIAATIPLAALVFSACGNGTPANRQAMSIISTENPTAQTAPEEKTDEPQKAVTVVGELAERFF